MPMRVNASKNSINPSQGQHLANAGQLQAGIWNMYVMFSFGAGSSTVNEFAIQFVDRNLTVIFDQRYWLLRDSGLVVPLQLAAEFGDILAVLQGSAGFNGTASVTISGLRAGNL